MRKLLVRIVLFVAFACRIGVNVAVVFYPI